MKFEISSTNQSGDTKRTIEQLLASKKGQGIYFAFARPLEQLFCHYSLSRYQKINVYYPFVGTLGLLLFLYADYQIAPDAIVQLLAIRLFGVALVCLSSWFLARPIERQEILTGHHRNQCLLSACTFIIHLIILQVGYIMASRGEYHYQTGSILLIMMFSTIIRVDFRYVVPTVLLIWGSQLYFVVNLMHADDSIVIEHVFMFTTVALFACMANARMEHEIRKTFLQSMLIEIEKTNLQHTQDQLRQLSVSDALTGLINRRGFEQEITQLWSSAARQKYPITLLMIDVDHFKEYNDSHGHPEGDRVLQSVAEVLTEHSKRPDDMAVRLGGDEFVVVLSQTEQAAGHLIAESIRHAVWEKNICHTVSLADQRITVSIGLATLIPEPNSAYQQLIQQADDALYRSKMEGRNQVK